MTTVYLLWHTHETTQDTDDDKLIGVYSSKGNAQNAMLRLRDQRGFKDHQDRFEVSEYVLDRDHWTEGCDVADEMQAAALVERAVATFGRLDMAYNNAGILGPMWPHWRKRRKDSTRSKRSPCAASGPA